MQKKFKYYSFIIRSLLIKTLLKFADSLGRFTYPHYNGLPQHYQRPLLVQSPNIKIALNSDNLYYHFKNISLEELLIPSRTSCYNWEELIESVKVEGIKNMPIAIRQLNEDFPNIRVIDGNHRLKALEILYGKDYEVVLDLYAPPNYMQYLKTLKEYKERLMTERLHGLYHKTSKYKK